MNKKSFLNENSKKVLVYKNNYYKLFFSRLIRKKAFIISSLVILILLSTSGFITLFTNNDKLFAVNFENSFIFPNSVHIFGTNEFGQDFFSQVFVGMFTTIKLVFCASLINLVLGVIIGSIWGHYSKIDNFMIFVCNIINNTPVPFFYIIIISAIGTGFIPILLVITLLGWINIAILVRNNLMTTRSKDYNLYSKMCNTSITKIAINNYLPSLLPIIFNAFAISVPETLSLEITLSYLGFSFGQNSISLGHLLYSCLSSSNWFNYWYLFVIPLFFIYIINISFFYLGKSISEAAIKEDDICLK